MDRKTPITRRSALALTALATLVGSKEPTIRRLSDRVRALEHPVGLFARFPRTTTT